MAGGAFLLVLGQQRHAAPAPAAFALVVIGQCGMRQAQRGQPQQNARQGVANLKQHEKLSLKWE